MPTSKKFRRLVGSMSVVLFFMLLVVAAVFGVVVFRAAFRLALIGSRYATLRQKSKIIVSFSAGVLNLLAINVLKVIYHKVAKMLTKWENPRTQNEYDDSFIIKMFCFQFINTYASIIYVAFFKSDAITGTPGRYKRFTKARIRIDGCTAQGCFLELTIQLVIIMVGQQVANNIFEILLPTVYKWMEERTAKVTQGSLNRPQWEQDLDTETQDRFSLFWEYLEMVLQYGFVTMFVTGFPLAPLFALINNIMEIRVDAYNFMCNRQRPVAQRVESIGAWYNILATLTSVSVLINGFVLAFTSELIPNMVYKYTVSPNRTLTGYVNWRLSYFNISNFDPDFKPNVNSSQDYCRYPGFHDPTSPYNRSPAFWKIMSIRLSFVLFFVIIVFFINWLISYVIPDMPKELMLTIKREKYLAKQADIDYKETKGRRRPSAFSGKSVAETVLQEIKERGGNPRKRKTGLTANAVV